MKRLEKISLIAFISLLLWFSLDLIGVPGFVTRDNLFSLSGVWEAILLIILVASIRKWKYSDFLALLIVAIWGYLQYDSHWRAFLFGESERWLEGYYRFFEGMYRFFPISQTRAIPDAYHTILGLLIVVNFVLLTIKILIFIKGSKKQPQAPGG
jgi:hypothetical protein